MKMAPKIEREDFILTLDQKLSGTGYLMAKCAK